MKDESALTVVIFVFDDKYCDLYFFTSEQKKLCANLMSVKSFYVFAKNLMSYPLMSKIEEIKAKLAETLHVEKVDTSANFKELGLDSLDIVELLLQLEEDYGIHFDDVDMTKIATVQDLLDSIEKQL